MILAAFRVRSFRYQWSADLLTSWAFEMETLVLGWYVMVHTGSVLLLTAFASLQYLGTLASPMFGVLGDRVGGRTMPARSRGLPRSRRRPHGARGGGVADAGMGLVIVAVAGIVRPNDLVMRNALIGDTMPPAHLMGALSLSRATADSARVAGALAGATLFAAIGMGSAYAVGRELLPGEPRAHVRHVPRAADRSGSGADTRLRPRPSRWGDLRKGLVHVLRTPRPLAVLLAFLVNLTAYPASSGLLPYVARRVYHVERPASGSSSRASRSARSRPRSRRW